MLESKTLYNGKKPKVSDFSWEFVAYGENTFYRKTPIDVEVYVQVDENYRIEHYRFKVDGKWHRKTFYGETAWSDAQRYVEDTWAVYVEL